MEDDMQTVYDPEDYLEAYSDFSDDFVDAEGFENGNGFVHEEEAFNLHRLAFDGKVDALNEALKHSTLKQKLQLDPQGNSILHLGVLQNNKEVVEVALENGIPSKMLNAKGWSALDEAISLKNKPLVSLLYHQSVHEVKEEMKKTKVQLMQTLNEMPDYSMELSWKLGSPVIGYFLRKFAPHDTYRIYKTGSKIRVDGTLMGIEKKTSSIFPEWKRGDFSLLFDGSTKPSLIVVVFHDSKTYIDLAEEKQERKKNGNLELDLDFVVADGAGRTKLKTTEFRFKPAKGWLTSQLTEKIENWNTRVYEASGKVMAVTRMKSTFEIPPCCTFEEYLKLQTTEDREIEIAVNPPISEGQDKRTQGGQPNHKAKPRKLTGKCWMAEDFPMSLRQLIPLLDVVGHANKHLGRISKFMRKYGDMNMFPVRVQVPLLLSIYLLVSFKKFKFSSKPPDWCDLPKGYNRVKLEDVLSNSTLIGISGLTSEDSASLAERPGTFSEKTPQDLDISKKF